MMTIDFQLLSLLLSTVNHLEKNRNIWVGVRAPFSLFDGVVVACFCFTYHHHVKAKLLPALQLNELHHYTMNELHLSIVSRSLAVCLRSEARPHHTDHYGAMTHSIYHDPKRAMKHVNGTLSVWHNAWARKH